MQFKKCAKCKTEKSLDDFYNNKTKKDGKREECKSCNKKIAQTHGAKEVRKAYYHKVLKYKDRTEITKKYDAKRAVIKKLNRENQFNILLSRINEEVKQIPNHPDYFITQSGDLYSRKQIKKLNKWINSNGYYQVRLDNKSATLHSLLLLVFLGPPPQKNMQINHIDGDKLNNSLCNLEYVTQRENLYHAMQLGLHSGSFRSCKLVDPNGREYVVNNLSEFCREHNLQQTNMWKVLHNKREHHLGWRGTFI